VNYFKAIEASRFDMGQLDAPLRGYGWSPLISDIAVARKDPLLRALVPLLENLVGSVVKTATSSSRQTPRLGRNPRQCTMFFPLGLGGHVDHLITREACSGLSQNRAEVYYEDLPYAEGLTEDEIERAVRNFDPGLRPHLFSIRTSLARKVENLRLYKTQVGDKEVEWVVRYANRLGANLEPCERLWYRPLPEDSEVGKSLEQAEYFPGAIQSSKTEQQDRGP
jgi:hypothetical protein